MSSSRSYSAMLEFLSQPRSYAHQPDEVRHIQTHISHVFMAPPFVYKIKKPVDFGFLDYSTLEKRRRLCYKEVELNRRLAADVYLGVVAITQREGRCAFQEDESSPEEVVEYAVKMKQLAPEYFLHRYIDRGELQQEHLDRVAGRLAEFYQNQKTETPHAKWGQIETIKVNTDENFDQTEPFIGQTIDRNTFEAIRYFTHRYYRQRPSLFQQRISAGCIVEGHGDLHLEHIHITDEQVRIYDCIEFNERFRYGDWAADLAFLAMDLDLRECWQQERYFIDQMADRLQDESLADILDFYKCYRAYVKGKVKSLQSAEEEVPDEERREAIQLARRYFGLALRYALLGSHPVVLVCMGGVGTGKTTIARHLSDRLNVRHFSSDRIRKGRAGQPLTERTPEAERKELYTPARSDEVYEVLGEEALKAVRQGESILLDATYGRRERRMQLIYKLQTSGVSVVFMETVASNETILERLQQREHQPEIISDARAEDLDLLNGNYEAPDELESDRLIRINTEQALSETIGLLYTKLVDWNMKENSI